LLGRWGRGSVEWAVAALAHPNFLSVQISGGGTSNSVTSDGAACSLEDAEFHLSMYVQLGTLQWRDWCAREASREFKNPPASRCPCPQHQERP